MKRLFCFLIILMAVRGLEGYHMIDPKALLNALVTAHKSHLEGALEKSTHFTILTRSSLQAGSYQKAQDLHGSVKYHLGNSKVIKLKLAIGALSKEECSQVVDVCSLFLALHNARKKSFLSKLNCCWLIREQDSFEPFLNLKKMVEQTVDTEKNVEQESKTEKTEDEVPSWFEMVQEREKKIKSIQEETKK